MDAQTKAIESACVAGIFREPEAKSIRILLRLVREQETLLTSHAPHGHNYTNGQYVWLELENERLKKQLAKYERVVEAAREVIQHSAGGTSGRYLCASTFFNKLANALESLETNAVRTENDLLYLVPNSELDHEHEWKETCDECSKVLDQLKGEDFYDESKKAVYCSDHWPHSRQLQQT